MNQMTIPLEIWVVSKVNKAKYPTGKCNMIKPRKIKAGIPFKVVKGNEILFWNNLIIANSKHSCHFRLLTPNEVVKYSNTSIVDATSNAKFLENRLNAESKIKQLEEALKNREAEIKSKEEQIINLTDASKINDDETALISEIDAVNKKLREMEEINKKLQKENKTNSAKLKKLKNEVKL